MLLCDPLIDALKRLLEAATSNEPSTGLKWNAATWRTIQELLSNSEIWETIFEAQVPPVGILAVEESDVARRFANEDEIARAGRQKRTGRIAIQIMPSRAKRMTRLASVLAHEYVHADFIFRRGFTATEAAPYLSLEDYTLLKRHDELEAFKTQLDILRQIRNASDVPFATKDALGLEIVGDPRLRALSRGDEYQARRLIESDYTCQAVAEHAEYSKQPSPAHEAAVRAFRASTAWPPSTGWSEEDYQCPR